MLLCDWTLRHHAVLVTDNGEKLLSKFLDTNDIPPHDTATT